MANDNNLALLEKRLIDSLFSWGVIEFEQSELPSWAVESGFFMKLSRSLASSARLSTLQGYYHQAVLRSLKEEPDFVYGPAHKGIPLATLTAMAIGGDRDVHIGFNLPGNVKHSVHDVVYACADDVMEIRRTRVPFLETSGELAAWAMDEAAFLSKKFEPFGQGEPSNFGFNTIVGDGSAIPAATALAVALAHYGVDADFAIPRRTQEAWKRADVTYQERKALHGNEKRAKREAAERLVAGRVQDHARSLLTSPAQESTGPIRNQPYEFGNLPGGKGKAIIVDDSIVTGRTANTIAETLKLRYADIEILGVVAAIHIQELVPHVRGERISVIQQRKEFGSRIPWHAVIDSSTVINYLHSSGRVSDDVYSRVTAARTRYKPQNGIASAV